MTRSEILEQIKEAIGGGDVSLFDRYSTSDLKKILDDMKRVELHADSSITNTVVLAGMFLILAVIILKRK